jgi:hypothetical protein
MRGFDFYEIVGVLVPGSILLVGISILYPQIRLSSQDTGVAVGEFGIFTLLAYGAGHLVQAIGNGLEWTWWRLWGGLPSDWIKYAAHPLLSESQRTTLLSQISQKLCITVPSDPAVLNAASWFGITRQMYAAVAGVGRSQRIDTFNATYGLSRGIAAAAVSLATLVLIEQGCLGLKTAALLFGAAAIAIYRMHRFGKHYARELFVQFLQLPTPVNIAGGAD